MKRLSKGKRHHLRWLVSPQGQKYGSLEALRAELRERLRQKQLERVLHKTRPRFGA